MSRTGHPRVDEAPTSSRASLVFSPWARALLSVGALAVGAAVVAWSSTVPADRNGYVMAHAVASAPFLAASLFCTRRAMRSGSPEYRMFWALWFAGCVTGAVATVAGFGAAAWDSPVLLGIDIAMLIAGEPFWAAATLGMVRAQVGRRSVSVDVIDSVLALAVLGAPVVLLVAEPLTRAEQVAFALPFAAGAVVTPGLIYLASVTVSSVERGRRVGFGIGVALGAAFMLNITLQLGHVLGSMAVPLPALVGAHAVMMALLMGMPLWAPRHAAGRLARLPAENQVRRSNPMPYVGALLLPALAVYVFAARDERPWGVPFLAVLLLVVVALNAVRYTAMSRETRRLYGDLARMSEERRRLLADMLRALEDDRRRTATELYAQTIESLTALGATIQGAYVALPADTALAVKEAISQAHSDLARRAEDLRQLMVAMRPPAVDLGADAGGAVPHALAAALRAYASEVFGDRSASTVGVEVDPGLELDWSTTTIAYRIAQEALLNAARHAMASTVAVRVAAWGDGILVEVRDDGVGFEPGPGGRGSGLAAMELFAQLGRGELDVQSAAGGGTVVRARLGHRTDASAPPPDRHLHVVSPPEPAAPD